MSKSSGGGSSKGGASKSRGKDSTDVITKSRNLLTKGEKLFALRNALFDDDPGGFGAERDVTRWVTPFKSYNKNGLELSIEFAHGESLIGKDLDDLVTLAAEFSQAVEEDAGREWHDEDKEEHLTEDAARFLVVRDNSGAVVGFAHFRFTLHGELADLMEGEPCLFIYDIAMDANIQRKGLGRHLMTMLELIARKANMCEMLMPIPVSDLTAPTVAFLENGLKGWAVDSLVEVSENLADAIDRDGTMQCFVKQLVPRAMEVPTQEEEEAAAVAAVEKGATKGMKTISAEGEEAAEGEGEAAPVEEEDDGVDDWGIEAAPSTPTKSKGKGKKGKKGKKGGKKGGAKEDEVQKAEPVPMSSPVSVAGPIETEA